MRNDTEFGDINIGDVLRLALPMNTILLGGGAQARRLVNWVAVLSSWDDLESQLKPNDLVLVPETLQQTLTPDNVEQKLGPLAELPVSGLLFLNPVDETTADLAGCSELAGSNCPAKYKHARHPSEHQLAVAGSPDRHQRPRYAAIPAVVGNVTRRTRPGCNDRGHE